jgi:alpha-L-fucosidase
MPGSVALCRDAPSGLRAHWRVTVNLNRALLLALGLNVACAAAAAAPPAVVSSIPGESAAHYAQRMKWFREAKFGWFICWGPCSLAGGEIGWSRNGPRPGIPGGEPGVGVPMEVYDNLYKQFAPTHFDPHEWASLIKESGAKYVIFLTRHHDGFSMFDSKLSDYKVTHTPYGRDVTGELAAALHEAGIRIVWYYSQPDWRHPDYLTEHHDRFIEYLHGQVRELLTNYGKIDCMWFDGLYGGTKEWDTPRLLSLIHQLQPGILINNRAGVPGDFDTPEQTLGSFQLDRPWESCITMSEGWSWTGEKSPVKSLRECLHLLIRCAGGGGNLALDTGPMPDGRIDPRQVANYKAMGQWLARYGETIYATTGGPYGPGQWGCATRQGTTVYLHVLNWPGDALRLPPLPYPVKACRALTGGEAAATRDAEGLTVDLSAAKRDDVDTLIALDLRATPAQVAAIRPASALLRASLSVGRRCAASAIWSSEYSAEKVFDGDESTRWGAAPDSRSGWLAVDLGARQTVTRATFKEAPWNRVQRYELQCRDTGPWRTFHRGTTMGDRTVEFPPARARHFRLNVLEATDVPTIWEVHLYGPQASQYTP